MVPAGSTITFQVQGSTDLSVPFFGDPGIAIRTSVLNGLTPYFYVDNVQVTTPSTLSMIENSYLFNFPYSAVVVLETRIDYGAIEDIGGIVAHQFYTVTGGLPSVTAPAYGQPAQIPGTQNSGPSIAGIGNSLITNLENAIKAAVTNLETAGAVVIVAIVGIVALLAFGKNKVIP